MTVKEFLDSLPEDKREMMTEFLYSRTPCKFKPSDTIREDIRLPLPELSPSSRVLSAVQQRDHMPVSTSL
jgi:hypothetical protein